MATHRTKHTYEEIRGSPTGRDKTVLLRKFLRPKPGGENTAFTDLLQMEKVATEKLIKLRARIKLLCPHARNRQVIYSWRNRLTPQYEAIDRFEVRCEACNTIVKEGSI